jgi:hypothetical protein
LITHLLLNWSFLSTQAFMPAASLYTVCYRKCWASWQMSLLTTEYLEENADLPTLWIRKRLFIKSLYFSKSVCN